MAQELWIELPVGCLKPEDDSMPTNPHPDDPAEGSDKAIDRQLERSSEKNPSQGEDKDHGGDKRERGTQEGTVEGGQGAGSEDAGRD